MSPSVKPGPLCDQCPLKDKAGPIWGVGHPSAKLVLIGQNPGPDEISAGEPFVGSSGRVLNRGLYRAGINRERNFVTNVVKCFVPPGAKVPPEAVKCCAPLLRKELDSLTPHAYLTLGIEAFNSLVPNKHLGFKTNKKDPTFWMRGYPYRPRTSDRFAVIGTYHPSALMRMGFAESPFFEADLRKAKRWEQGNGEYWTEEINYTPCRQEVDEYVQECIARENFGLDIETPESVVDEEELVGRGPTRIDVIGISRERGSALGCPPDLFSRLAPLFQPRDHRLTMYAFNGGFDGYHISTNGFPVENVRTFDLMLALNLLYSDAVPKDLGMALSIFGDMPYHKNMPMGDPLYNARDAYGALYGGQIAWEALTFAGSEHTFWEQEMPLVPIVEEMRTVGVRCDLDYAQRAELMCYKRLQKYEEYWRSKIPNFSWSSPQQLVNLFRMLHMPIQMKNRKKQKTGEKYQSECVDEVVLIKYRDEYKSPVAGLVLEMRTLKKAGDFTHFYDSDGRARTQYKIHGQKAGRLQSKEPDLQNIPEEIADIYPRKIVLPDDDNSVIISADFSQIELRIYAFAADDKPFLEAFNRGDYIYGQLYEDIFKEPFFQEGKPRTKANKRSDIPPWKLLVAKSGPLGLIYGRRADSLTRMGITKQHAIRIYDAFFTEHEAIAKYHSVLRYWVEEQYYLRNFFGRLRRFPNPEGMREKWMSFPGQSNAADILRQNALIPFHKDLRRWGARTMLTVHDSVVVSTPRKFLDEVHEYMQTTLQQPIPQMKGFWIPAELKVGLNWHDIYPLVKFNAQCQRAVNDI